MKIAIDGPAGAGKSTIAKEVAAKKGCLYIDTGAMYRTVALYIIRKGISLEDEEQVSSAVGEADITLSHENGTQRVFLNGEDVSADIRREEVGNGASKVSRYAAVREKLVDCQRKMAERTSVVMDGRDIGTVVLPDAEVKIYLTAASETRARRRFLELKEKGAFGDTPLSPAEVEEKVASIKRDIEIRDGQDMNREISPLKKADDAVTVDTSFMTITEVTERILTICDEKENANG